MMWIATLCLLSLAAWFVMNALNERQWVQSHSDDETVAADPGFIPDISKVSQRADALKKNLSLKDDNTPISRAVSKVQTGSERVGQRLGSVARAAKVDSSEEVRYTGPTGAALLGAAVAKVGVDTDGLGQRVKERAMNTLESQRGSDGIVAKVSSKVSAGIEKVNHTVGQSRAGTDSTQAAKPAASTDAQQALGDSATTTDELVERVSGKVERVVKEH